MKAWLMAGDPPHWCYVVGVALLVVEDGIARSKLASNSTIQLIGSLLRKIPGVGRVLGFLGPAVVLLLAGCATKVVPYQVLAVAAESAAAVARQLPPQCERVELETAKQQATRDRKISQSLAVHQRCQAAARALTVTHEGLMAARNLVATSPREATQWSQWVATAMRLYGDLAPVLSEFGLQLPGVRR